MCVWCGGVALGDVGDRYCALYPASCHFRWLAEHLNELWDEQLFGLDDVAAWNFLDGLLYGYHGDEEVKDTRTLEQLQSDGRQWNKYNFLTNWGEQFDGYKSFILCPPQGQVRILSRWLPAKMGRSITVSRKAVLAASQDFARWFAEQAQRLQGNGSGRKETE